MLAMMLLLASLCVSQTALRLQVRSPFDLTSVELSMLRVPEFNRFDALLFELASLRLYFWALLPPPLLHFPFAFPEGNRSWGAAGAWRPLLYGMAFLPLAAVLGVHSLHQSSGATGPAFGWFVITPSAAAAIAALLNLSHNVRHPPDPRARNQIRWVAVAYALPMVGLAALTLLSET